LGLTLAVSAIGGTGLPAGSLGPVVGASDGVPDERGLGVDVFLAVGPQERRERGARSPQAYQKPLILYIKIT
jgi:hypothetical protein